MLLLNAIKDRDIEIPVLFAVWCGMRRGEIAGLRWEDIDFESKKIYIKQAMVRAEGGHIVKTPKSFSGTREIPLPRYVEYKLRVAKACSNSDFVVGRTGHTIYQKFKAFLREHPGLPNMRFHDLRHAYVKYRHAIF